MRPELAETEGVAEACIEKYRVYDMGIGRNSREES